MAAVNPNSVIYLQKTISQYFRLKKKKKIKDLGPEQPDLHIQQQASDRGRSMVTLSVCAMVMQDWLTADELWHGGHRSTTATLQQTLC